MIWAETMKTIRDKVVSILVITSIGVFPYVMFRELSSFHLAQTLFQFHDNTVDIVLVVPINPSASVMPGKDILALRGQLL
jgi:hypothetical protein